MNWRQTIAGGGLERIEAGHGTVPEDGGILGDKPATIGDRLSDEHSVERVVMMARKGGQFQRMGKAQRELAESVGGDGCRQLLEIDVDPSEHPLDRDLPYRDRTHRNIAVRGSDDGRDALRK